MARFSRQHYLAIAEVLKKNKIEMSKGEHSEDFIEGACTMWSGIVEGFGDLFYKDSKGFSKELFFDNCNKKR